MKYTHMVVITSAYNISCKNSKNTNNVILFCKMYLASPKNRLIAALCNSIDETGPGFDSISPLITTCFRFKNEVSYANNTRDCIVIKLKKNNVHDIFRRMPDSISVLTYESLRFTFSLLFVLHAADSGKA